MLRDLIACCRCRDTAAPEAYLWHDSPDAWLRRLQERIDADIREAEARARAHLDMLCNAPAAKDA